MPKRAIDPAVLEHFADSWARSYVEDTSLKKLNMQTRSVKADGEDSLFGDTLRSDSTIKHAISLWRPPQNDLGETMILASLGDGLNGHAKIVHGGFTAMLVDETCGLANHFHNRAHTFTANLSVNYKKPIPAPSVILCRAWITKVDGRKRYISCTVEGPEGIIYAECDTLFLEFKEGFKL